MYAGQHRPDLGGIAQVHAVAGRYVAGHGGVIAEAEHVGVEDVADLNDQFEAWA